ncbi:MAG: hypothetical protein V3T77_06810, partial [Planctomycetota bacterium]
YAAQEGSLTRETSFLDERSRELWLAKACRGAPWLQMVGSELHVDLPMTLEAVNHLQMEIIGEVTSSQGGKPAALAQLLAYLRHLELGHEVLRLSFGAPDGEDFHFTYRDKNLLYRPALLQALLSEGMRLDRELARPELQPR